MMNQNIWCLVSLASWDVVPVPKVDKVFPNAFFISLLPSLPGCVNTKSCLHEKNARNPCSGRGRTDFDLLQ